MGRFDEPYYGRFYSGPDAVHDAAMVAHLASAVHHLCAWWGVEPRSVLDVGAGVGHWRDWYRSEYPDVAVTSVDISAYACRTFGHQQRDISVWSPRHPSDLVVCHGVLQYLDDSAAERAIENLARATRHVLYVEVPTEHDLAEVVDPDRTDMEVFDRSGKWYRSRLEDHFHPAGAGLWVVPDSVVLYELEGSP